MKLKKVTNLQLVKPELFGYFKQLTTIKIRTRLILIGILFLGLALTSSVISGATGVTNITINGKMAGAVFDGIGAISGGSGTSRLLIDYPEPERDQILNYLFKPDYGASLQLLKLEIGGGAGLTDGSEASIEPVQGKINCNSGYEWWVADQAVARNPNIRLYGLQWSAPGWTGNGPHSLWTNKNVNYVIDWLNCAKAHGLKISYIGGWDEEGYNASWYEQLRSALNRHGYGGTKIVAADSVVRPWAIATALSHNPKFRQAVNIIGVHDTCASNPTSGYSCNSSVAAKKLGIPLWESELGGMPADSGAAAMVRSIINGYDQAGITGYLEWPMADSMLSVLPFQERGLLTAEQPWTGHYSINLMTWAIAQTTQFTQPGWRYVNGANGPIANTGAYSSFESPSKTNWSLVAENTGTYYGQKVKPKTLHINIVNLPHTVVHVWQTDVWANNQPSKWFIHESDIHPVNNEFVYTIQPGMVVTFTSTSGQAKVAATSPPAQNIPLPYSNQLSVNDGSNEPALLSSQDGSFALTGCLGGQTGLCTQQMTAQLPVLWGNGYAGVSYPYAIIGSSWTNYTVSVDLLFQQPSGSGGVIGRYGNRSGNIGNFDGYLFNVSESGSWQILKNQDTNLPSKPVVLASGSVSPLGLDTWHTISLGFDGYKIDAMIDGVTVGSAIDSSYSSGLAGIEADAFTNNWSNNQYQKLVVTPVSATDNRLDTVGFKSAISPNSCLDDYRDGVGYPDRPNKVDIWNCNGTVSQRWLLASGSSLQINGQCLGTYQIGKTTSNKVVVSKCIGGPNQIWQFNNGRLINSSIGKCIYDPNANPANGTQLLVGKCSNNKDQVWIKT